MSKETEKLKDALPHPTELLPNLKKKTENEHAGSCPKCGGDDRFIVWGNGRYWCRGCNWHGDKIDFFKWYHNCEIEELQKTYLSCSSDLAKSPTSISKDPADHSSNNEHEYYWRDLIEESTNTDPIYRLFVINRKISKSVIEQAIKNKSLCFYKYYRISTVACVYRKLGDDKAATAIQYISVGGDTLTRDGKAKIFKKGSKAQEGFFQCGKPIDEAEIIILTEAVIDALSISNAYPDACVLAVGGTSLTKKVKSLRKYRDADKKIICFFDHDDAGKNATKEIAKIIGVKTLSINWPECSPNGCDANDLLKNGDKKLIVQMIQEASKVEIDKSSVKKAKGTDKICQLKKKQNSYLPTIKANNIELSDLRKQAWDAINKSNNPPYLFTSPQGICRIVEDKFQDNFQVFLKVLYKYDIRHILSSVAHWSKERFTKDDILYEDTPPPMEVCIDLLCDIDPPLPYLDSIIHAPVFTRDGKIHSKSGYSKDSRKFLFLSKSLTIPDIPLRPTGLDKNRAKIILEELLCDFPFVSRSELAHTHALLILPFVRDLIAGSTPLHLIEAPTPGTGKSLLVKAVAYIALGRQIEVTSEVRDDEEWRKRITSKLMTSPIYFFVDNIVRKIDSGALSAAITSEFWEDRILQKSKNVHIPISCCWVVTGNNPVLSSEMARRAVRIRLDSKSDRPWERKTSNFRHPNLLSWVKDNRGELIWAALTMIQAWFMEGCPKPKNISPLGGFEEWSDIVGGILEVNEIPGFLQNLNQFYEDSDAEGAILRSFIKSWWDQHKSERVGVSDLYRLVIDNDIPIELGKGNERSQKIVLGKKLKTLRDKQIGDFKVITDGQYKNAQQYRLKHTFISPVNTEHKLSPINSPTNFELNQVDNEYSESGECFSDPKCAGEDER
jgi:putative DNA primase/helicase